MNESDKPEKQAPNFSDSDVPERAPSEADQFPGADMSEDLDSTIAALLSEPGTWVDPPAALDDRIALAVRSEAGLGVADPIVSERRRGQDSRPLGRRAWLRPAVLGAAAAIVLLFGGIVVLSGLSGVPDDETFSADLVSTGLIPDVGGEVEVTSFDSGLQIDLNAAGLPRRDDGAFYEGWVRTVNGDLVAVGTFHDGDAVILWAGVELERIDLFTITLETAVGPVDPEQGSSGEIVLRAALAP